MKILVVDDEPLVRKSLGRAFRAKGHEVIETADGIEGLARWTETLPDLVLLDVLMPGLSGPDVLRKIMDAKLQKSSRVILMSAYVGEHATDDVMGNMAGVDLFVAKPFDDIFALVTTAEALLGRSS
jgi:DNA-binding response OmpR family regulator